MLEVVVDVVVNKVVDKEVDKEVEEVNNKLVKEVNEGLVLVWKCGDGRGGDHEVDYGHRDDVLLDMEADVDVNQEADIEVNQEADVEVNQEVDKEVANVANVDEFSHQKSLKVHMVTTYWGKAFCMWTMC